MRWRGERQSSNVEDRRGRSAPRGIALGGGTALIVVIVALLFGIDPSAVIDTGSPSSPGPQAAPPDGGANDEAKAFVSTVLASTEDVWGQLFANQGAQYQAPRLVLFTDAVRSACGINGSATGPFYCPPDQNIYLDLGFFDQLARLGGPGDFAAAYVIAHEVGHHIQRLLGTEAQVRSLRQRVSQAEANALSVRMELQADCYAGVWAYHAEENRDLLEDGDIEEGLNAAAAIGDDRLQQRAGQAVQPESFTHGTSQQRARWFSTGLRSGRLDACDTFS